MRVAVVEDDPFIRKIAALALGRVGGFDVVLMSDGAELIERWREVAPDVILLDVMMPGVDGPTALAALRAEPDAAGIPVIFATARAQTSEIAEYMELGVTGVILKPFDPMSLADQVRALLAGAA